MDGHKKTSDASLVFCFLLRGKISADYGMLSLEYWLYESQDPIC
jgi:hypothetical protein